MAAQTEVRVFHGGAPGLGVDVTGQTLRFKRADNDAQDSANLVPVPAAGLAYSWRKSFKLVMLTAPDNEISDLRFFADAGSLGTGRRILFARSAAYNQATAADETVPISAVDVTTKTSGSPESIQPGVLATNSDTFPTAAGTAGSQDHVELQVEQGPTATVGNAAAAMTVRYRYTES